MTNTFLAPTLIGTKIFSAEVSKAVEVSTPKSLFFQRLLSILKVPICRSIDNLKYVKECVSSEKMTMPKRIYNPITAIGFSVMFSFQLDNTKR